MNRGLHFLVAAMLYIFTATVLAHPGPHTHVGVPEGAWHALIGWELALLVCVTGSVWLILRRLRTLRSK